MSQFCISQEQFLRQKNQCLSGTDLSRKGSIDRAIFDIVAFINEQPGFFTTSSCSGRIIIVDNVNAGVDSLKKKGCQWLYITHDKACFETVKSSLQSSQGAAVFKFEPMVMHIQVHTLSDAQNLQTTAVASGFRNSGISIGGKGKIVVAVRSTHSLEVPVCQDGQLLVSHDYIKYLVECGNKKMEENFSRIKKFLTNLQATVEKLKGEAFVKEKKPRNKKKQISVAELTISVSEQTSKSNEDLAGLEENFNRWLFEET